MAHRILQVATIAAFLASVLSASYYLLIRTTLMPPRDPRTERQRLKDMSPPSLLHQESRFAWLGPLRRAHRTDDWAAIEHAEDDLIAEGRVILDQLYEAFDAEQHVGMQDSLGYVIRSIEFAYNVTNLIHVYREASQADRERLPQAILRFHTEDDPEAWLDIHAYFSKYSLERDAITVGRR